MRIDHLSWSIFDQTYIFSVHFGLVSRVYASHVVYLRWSVRVHFANSDIPMFRVNADSMVADVVGSRKKHPAAVKISLELRFVVVHLRILGLFGHLPKTKLNSIFRKSSKRKNILEKIEWLELQERMSDIKKIILLFIEISTGEIIQSGTVAI